jgi:hypothetical protein
MQSVFFNDKIDLGSAAGAPVIHAGLRAGITDGAQNFTNNELIETPSFTHRIETGGKAPIQRVGDARPASISESPSSRNFLELDQVRTKRISGNRCINS